MELVRCTDRDLPARMNEIQWQAMWRYYILPGHVKPPDSSFESSIKRSDLLLDTCLIAVVDGEDAGFCWGAVRGEAAWCGGFGVRPEFRGLGVGQALLRGTAQALREHGARVWRLEVVQHNHSAVQAYLRAGFKQLRDLALLRGKVDAPTTDGEEIRESTAAECLDRYATWPQVQRTWGSSPDQLRLRQEQMSAKELARGGAVVAFMLHGGNGVIDVGLAPGESGESGLKLIGWLPSFSWGNLSDDDPVRPFLDAHPGVECWVKQWEMEWVL